MFTYHIYIGVFNETVHTTDRAEAIDRLSAWSAKLKAIKMNGRPTGFTYSKLPK